jgi:hypothetical protein
MGSFDSNPQDFKVPNSSYDTIVSEGRRKAEIRRSPFWWRPREDYALIEGIFRKGWGQWDQILSETIIWRDSAPDSRDLRIPQWNYLCLRAENENEVVANLNDIRLPLKEEMKGFIRDYLPVRASFLINRVLE